jgi:hypothetical protein
MNTGAWVVTPGRLSKKRVIAYNRLLRDMGIADHQVERASNRSVKSELDDLAQRQVLSGNSVQSSGRLDDLRVSIGRYDGGFPTHLHGFPVRGTQSHSAKSIMDLLKQLSTSISLVRSSKLELLDQMLIHRDGRAEFDDGSGPEFVGVEVREANRDELHVETGICSHSTESHDREPSF